jgi:hypothetical protein
MVIYQEQKSVMLEVGEALDCRPEKGFNTRTQTIADEIPVDEFIEDLNKELKSRGKGHEGLCLETLEVLKHQVAEVRQEWIPVAATLKTQRERLEALLESFPGPSRPRQCARYPFE